MKLPYTENPMLYLLRWNHIAHWWNIRVIRAKTWVELYRIGCAADLLRLAAKVSPRLMADFERVTVDRYLEREYGFHR